jgi:ABC-type multidrug transport system ATPase subunit
MVIQVRDWVMQFGSVTALDLITLAIPQSALFGFIGLSGCGKTATVDCMIGNYQPTEGVVKVFDRTHDFLSLRQESHWLNAPAVYPLPGVKCLGESELRPFHLRLSVKAQGTIARVAGSELSRHEKKLVRHISGGMQRALVWRRRSSMTRS